VLCAGDRAVTSRSRRLRGSTANLVVLVVALLSWPVVAQVPPPSQVAALGSAGPETLVVQITLNGERKGQYFVSVINGEFLIRKQDILAIGVTTADGTSHLVAGETLVWANSIPGLHATFNEPRLSLDLVADPSLLPVRTVDLWAGRGNRVFFPDNASAFFNYDVGYSGGNLGLPDGLFATTQLGMRKGNLLFLSDTTCSAAASDRSCIRLTTSLIHDRRDTLVRTVAGDFGFASGHLGTTFNMGGLSYSKLYDMDPYLIRYPQQGLTGQLLTPSEVDVYVDGQRIRTLRLPAGTFDLRNITQATGFRSVDLVIRDSFGREQRVNTSFYSSDRSLRAGLHEYSYNVGALRENYGVASNDYGPLAVAGFHRYGWSDTLTVGFRAEGRSGRANAGPAATIVLGAAGLLNVAASISEDGGQSGGAGLVSYSYLGQHFNASLFARKDSPSYATLVDVGIDRRNYEVAGNVGYSSPQWGSMSAGLFTYKPYDNQERKGASMSYGRPLFDGRASFFVTLVNERAQDTRTSIFAGFSYNFDVDYSLNAYYQRLRGGTSESLQFQKAQPVGDGLGYVLGISRNEYDGESNTQFTPSFQYNSRWATVRGFAQQSDGQGAPRNYSLAVAGGIAWAEGLVAAGRPVTDSFGVVKVDSLEGVKVSVNGQSIGTTASDGRLFVPSLASFLDNQITIDVANVPLDYTFPESTRTVSPAYRAGAVINFEARQLRAFIGKLAVRMNGEVRPAERVQVTLNVEGRPLEFVTGRGGEFYVEDLKAGRYTAHLGADGTRCSFEFVVTEATGPMTDLGETICTVPDDTVGSAAASRRR